MTGKKVYASQIAEIKAHMGELRSDGKSVERLLAARAAEPTYSQMKDAWDGLFAWGDEFRDATNATPEDIACAVEEARRAISLQRIYQRDLIHIAVGPLKVRWFLDCGEWFLYVHWRNRWWRFSSVGFCKSVPR